MKYSKQEVDAALFSLRASLEKVRNPGLCIVWIVSLILFKFNKKDRRECIVSPSAVNEVLPDMYSDLFTDMCRYKNAFVHAGVYQADYYINKLFTYESISDELFNLADVPKNARKIYRISIEKVKAGELDENI